MPSFRPAHFARLGLLLAALGIHLLPSTALISTAYAADEKKVEAPQDVLRAEFAAPFKGYEEAMKNKDYKGALAKIAEMEAIPTPSAFERYKIERLRIPVMSSMGDNAGLAKSIEAALESGRMEPSEFIVFSQALVSLHYQAKDYPKNIAWIDRYNKAGGKDPRVRFLYIQVLYAMKDYKKAYEEAQVDIKADLAAGKTPNEDLLKTALNCTVNTNDKATYWTASQQLLTYYPQRELWDDILGRYMSNTANSERWFMHYFRLRIAMGLMTSVDEYMEMAELGLRSGQPGEVKRALEQGYQAGILGKTGDVKKQNAMRDRANKVAADDIKTLDQAEGSMAKAKEGTGLINVGYALIINGKAEKGLPMIEQGLKLGTKKTDEMTMLAAIGYAAAGKKDEALKLFAKVQSSDGGTELSRFWTMQLTNPMK
ncbi:MAG: hypothetical protein HYZ45_01005 [Burkholderiales bacterium]|nr:hypothetical protein [Burkholderiales bacterium]